MASEGVEAGEAFRVEVFHDGACPLCRREMRMMERLDRKRRIRFTDISSRDFDPTKVGVTWETLMAKLHGRLPDGTLIEGVEVFRELYAAVGFAPLVALTRLPGVSYLMTLAYHLFAKNRLRLTGRCTDRGCEIHRAQADARP